MPRPPLRSSCQTVARLLVVAAAVIAPMRGAAQAVTAAPLPAPLTQAIDAAIAATLPRVVAWRRDIHAHPELSWQEARTAALVAEHLRTLGLEVRAGVAGTHGVVGILKGARPGPVVALRADMDALPVVEQTGLPFASTVRATYNDNAVGVMHACGHDTHVAILMGVASVLRGMQAQLPGTVVFVFQPAEEGGANAGGGAVKMIEGGALSSPKVDAIYGLHSWPGPVGTVALRAGALMASTDNFRVVVRGRQTHGAQPWGGIDPIVTGAAIVTELQSIVSRRVDLTTGPAVVTTGIFNGGVRENIIPDSAVLRGTIRTFARETRQRVFEEVRRLATNVAEAHGATAEVTITEGYPVTVNDPRWFPRPLAVLQRALGDDKVLESRLSMPAEDFSFYMERVPGAFFFLGGTPVGTDPMTIAPNHSPFYDVDEGALPVGMKALAHLAVDALVNGVPPTVRAAR
ncbi:MAG: amidohydrolase [Gemmatimonadaceae bacterium]|nr:amidohydrolase [Gemmatimonadaceae bacterium]